MSFLGVGDKSKTGYKGDELGPINYGREIRNH